MTWDGDLSRMGALQQRIADLASVPSRSAKRVSLEIERLIEQEFSDGTDPYGTPWADLSDATYAKGRTPPPLTDTGAMRSSVSVRPMSGSGVSISIDHPAAPHQTGWSGARGTGPARPVLPSRQMPTAWSEAIAVVVADEIRQTVKR